MKQNVKIKVINIKAIAAVDPDEVAHITDENIVETVINSVEFQKMEGMLAEKSEKYNILDITTRLLREELWQLKNQGLIIGNVHWKFEFYFSSNWKFLIICLGFNSPTTREVIIKEMQRIGVCFQFWQERDFNKWSYTSLMGQEKLKVLHNFNLETILEPVQAKMIQKLWDDS
ncbi:uncharacterized protein OCT59_023350 [Rhizophagus irregularis]|uniref:uncharacterized protein n=1 Tax=Rhizophagus irregularis TaxID=588596 RepID=UPI003329DCDF|nr:hypothetical protein OCT59_023350 [Rhizophagus irregularis]